MTNTIMRQCRRMAENKGPDGNTTGGLILLLPGANGNDVALDRRLAKTHVE